MLVLLEVHPKGQRKSSERGAVPLRTSTWGAGGMPGFLLFCFGSFLVVIGGDRIVLAQTFWRKIWMIKDNYHSYCISQLEML